MARRLDGFQATCLRSVLRIAPSFYSRVSNKEVLRRARHKLATEILLEQQLSQLGRVLRSHPNSPLRSSSLYGGTLQPLVSHYIRRIGRPNKEWMPTILAEAARRAGGYFMLPDLAQNCHTWA